MEKARKLADILERVRCGEDPTKIRQQARQLLSTLRLSDISKAHKYLVGTGISLDQLRTLVYAFASILGDQFALLRANLSADHPVRRILAEHEMFECFLADLEIANVLIQDADELTELSSEFRRLAHVAEHLQAIDVHDQREDDLVFPVLENYPCRSICVVLGKAHWRIKNMVSNLTMAVNNFRQFDQTQFKIQINALSSAIVPILREHIFQEDNILYPVALDVIKDDRVWWRIKQLSDEMGYCGFDSEPCCS
ncbi:MAG: hypothetical protein A2Y12_19340 [Planctomycetes bacterium GWF2_42_9]|nr:MAG: hypothetical protein A2Y12_19340 [Planctomycetes bacterium GWF2_42_9]HAL45670.1 hypothetical protein [Phycisphaerales bacterium]